MMRATVLTLVLPSCVRLAVLAGFFVIPSVVSAEIPVTEALPKHSSQPGQPIQAWSADPLMTVEQEQQILSKLRSSKLASKPDGNSDIALNQLVDKWSDFVPVAIDRVSLEEIGLTEDVPVMLSRYGDLPLLAQMSMVLRDIDLTFTIRGGIVLVQTVERANSDLCIRVYDISPLVDDTFEPFDAPQASRSLSDQQLQLVKTIQETVYPDSWEALGGTGTTALQTVHGKHFFVIAQRTEVHLAVQQLLDRLNGAVISELQQKVVGESRAGNGRPSIPRFSGANRSSE